MDWRSPVVPGGGRGDNGASSRQKAGPGRIASRHAVVCLRPARVQKPGRLLGPASATHRPRSGDESAKEISLVSNRPFSVLGIQQIAVGGLDKQRLKKLW